MTDRKPTEPWRDYADPHVLDEPDPFDPTGYYARKAKHRAEMLPFLAAMWGICILVVAGAVIWHLVT